MIKRKLEDEINFKDLIKNPLRLFGWIYPLFFLLLIVLGVMYVKNLRQISYNQQPVLLQDSIRVWQDIEEKKGGILPAVDLTTLSNPSQDLIAAGKELYDANCQSCHGADGKGDGAAGVALNPKPRNFHETEGWTNGRTFTDLYKTLQVGIIQNGMAAYEYIAPQNRVAIIQYVRTFADYPAVTEEEIAQLDAEYKLSEGTETPNQIPVMKAISLISSETNQQIINDLNVINYIDESGYKLFREYAVDKIKIANAFKFNEVNSFDNFVKIIQSDPVTLGFKAEVLTLNNEQMKELFDFIYKITS
jgi:mono/diheme cytochrome c family protein